MRFAANPSPRLELFQDPDAFLQLALVRLDLLFEADPARRKQLRELEQVLEGLEWDWPLPPAQRIRRHRPLDLGDVFRKSVELTASDIPGRFRHAPGTRTQS
ncbi:hypothetical protein [Mesoterricola silvestris]|uniref:Uncharacterized protein n=1 Tax=Mesoterricola silvestris TaxID=2927979 RepID=A0AA48GQW5_9BACT|nr:hypothetical protein [Mesoterricola silvestris]BDU72570.1 hypothetical protein METEAL_17440 [Mesoterricola silvestris]